MNQERKSGLGYCTITLKGRRQDRYPGTGLPLMIYTLDENGNPVIDEKSVILLLFEKYYPETDTARVQIHGLSAQWVRAEVILKNYDPMKSRLSREDHQKLLEVLKNKTKSISEGRRNHKIAHGQLEAKV